MSYGELAAFETRKNKCCIIVAVVALESFLFG